jgi:phage terminase small subunit
MSAKNEHGLTPQQEKFCQEIARGLNQSDAYRAAYKAGKMTPKQIHEEASKLAANPKVSQRVAQLQRLAADAAVLDRTEILRELRRVAKSDIAGIMRRHEGRATVLLPDELDPATRAAVASFKMDEFGRIEYKFWDKNAALDKAMKHLGLFEADNAQKPVEVREVRLVALSPEPATSKGEPRS